MLQRDRRGGECRGESLARRFYHGDFNGSRPRLQGAVPQLEA